MKTIIIFPLKALSIGIFSIMLSACGEETDHIPPAMNQPVKPPVTTPPETSPPVKPPVTSIPVTPIRPGTPSIPSTPIGSGTKLKYPEPKKDIADAYLLGFFDHAGRAGAIRDIRPDLVGTFQAMIQFGQNHTIDPQGNEAKNMPRLTAEKEALLLVTPTLEMGDIDKLLAEIYKDGVLLRTVNLADPTQIPATDQTNTDKRPRVSYSNRAWSTKLKWNEVEGGLKIRIVDEQKRSGELLEYKIDFAAPGELVLTNIRLGMLTAPPQSWGHYMLRDPERAGSDYFQTIPAAQMTVAAYDDMKLDRVMVANGTIYDSVSDSNNASVYNGDMRENTAKATFGVGMNLANWGVTSASMQSQEQPQLTQNVNAHHARGKYANGEHNHGLSGGNGMLTIIDSQGNEFSHEIGHHYGLSHYPGKDGNDYFWAEHHADSGWGYNGVRNKMRSNLDWSRAVEGDGLSGKPLLLATYGYGRDAMSGGTNNSSLSNNTHYTGYSTKIRIQPAFDRAVFDADSPTGYKKWNPALRKMEVIQPKVPKSTNVWYNRADGNYLKPRLQGVPVFTILGGYDPVAQNGIIYPEARGNWGNVFDLPTPNNSLEAASCWLSVTYSNNTVNNIALSPNRMNGNANKFHINLAIAENPKKVDLYCKKVNEAQVQLSTIDIREYSNAIKPAVTFGKEQGYTALRKVELPNLEKQLIAQAENPTVILNTNGKLLYDSYKEYRAELSLQALQTLERYEQQQQTLKRLNRWVDAYNTDLTKKEPEALTAFQKFVELLNLQDDKPLENATTIRNGNNCLKVEKREDGTLNTFISGQSGCTGDDYEQWVYDAKGKIHSKMALDQCLTERDSWVGLGACSLDSPTQVWNMNGATEIKQGNKCFDLRTGNLVNNRGSLITYNCNGGWNQKWTTLTKNPSFILATVGSNLPLIVDSLQKQPAKMDNMRTLSLNADSTEEPSVLAKLSSAISTFIDDLVS